MIEVREALRAVLLANNGVPAGARRGRDARTESPSGAPLEARFDLGGTIGVTGPRPRLDGALGRLLAVSCSPSPTGRGAG